MRYALGLALLLCACGDNAATSAPDAAITIDAAPMGFVEAPHDTVPQVQSGGGAVLATPVVVPIFFIGDDTAQAQLEQFLTQTATSDYWHATTSEYGVGNLTILPSVVSTDTPPTTDDLLQTFITTNLDGTHGWPASTPNTIYAVFLPEGVVLSEGSAMSCVAGGFGGYHSEVMMTGSTATPVIYALLPRCDAAVGEQPLDDVTSATSHELVEATTDPHPFTDPAYVEMDPDHFIWGRTPGAELGDMCEFLQPSIDARLVGTFNVQRTWSNASALAGHDPCVPAPATPYIAAAPRLDNDITLMGHGGMITTKGIQVTVGTTKTIEVDLFSDALSPLFLVQVFDAATVLGGTPTLSFQFDKTDGKNGDKLNLNITRTVAASARGSEILLLATTPDGTPVSQWWAFIAE
jgi:hypothetical protein